MLNKAVVKTKYDLLGRICRNDVNGMCLNFDDIVEFADNINSLSIKLKYPCTHGVGEEVTGPISELYTFLNDYAVEIIGCYKPTENIVNEVCNRIKLLVGRMVQTSMGYVGTDNMTEHVLEYINEVLDILAGYEIKVYSPSIIQFNYIMNTRSYTVYLDHQGKSTGGGI